MSLIGQTIKGTYQVYDEVGQGAAATVYLARDLSRNRLVAVKAIHPHLAKEGRFLDRFRREADLLRQLASPYVAQVYDYGMEGDTNYIVMEYVQGKSLTTILEESDHLEVSQALDIARQVAQCLDEISAQGIVHRDIKPGNIMLTPDGQVKIMDFGIAKGLVMTGLTQTGVLGTPYYLSPEQGEGDQELDVRSDIYSLGVVLFQLLTGERPYEDSQPVALIMKHLNEPIPSLRALREEIPQDVENLVVKCLAKRREDRFQTAQELIQAISQIQSPRSGLAEPTIASRAVFQPSEQLEAELNELHMRLARLETQSPPTPIPVQPVTPPKGSGLQRAGMLFLLAVALLVGSLGLMLPSANRGETPTVVATPPNLDGPIAAEVERQLADRLTGMPTSTPIDLSAPIATEVTNQLPDLSAPIATEVANRLPDLSAAAAAEAVRQVEARLAMEPTDPVTITIPDGSISRQQLDFATTELVHGALWQGRDVCFDLIAILQELGYVQCIYASSPGGERGIWHSTIDCSDSPSLEPSPAQRQSIWRVQTDPEVPVYAQARWLNLLPYVICAKGP